MYSHYLILGDSFEILPKLQITVDAVIVDPPYNTANKNTKELKGRKARSSDFGKWDYFSDNEYLEFTKNWIKLIKPILKKSGNLLTFAKLEYVSDIRRLYEKEGFKHHGTIIWHKTNPAPQIRKTGFLSSCEAILWATNGFDDEKISYTFNFTTQKEMHNFIETPICMGKERTEHPTQKPKKVISHLVKLFTNKNDIILDCFAGSGTLAEVASELNRRSINIEKSKLFFKIMVNRLKKTNNNLFSKDNQILVITNEKDIVLVR
ncbi:site-specific DNA-methyltransferase [bacterium]|nr:site-specific DNA-methyltransferase [bacterium]